MNAEQLLTTRFAKKIWNPFVKAVKEYRLVNEGDRIAVCVSGGKDSALLSVLMRMLQLHSEIRFEVLFLSMDPGYSPERRQMIERGLTSLGVQPYRYETKLFDTVAQQDKNPCFLCARLRRGSLYKKAQELGCNKIALGHHFDDVIETIVMGMLYGAQIQTMMPKLHSTNFEGMELIRPMYLIREEDIKRWRDYNDLHFIQCACKFTDNCSSEGCKQNNTGSKRKRVKQLNEELKAEDPQIEANIFKSVENVNLATVIAYKDKNNVTHHFLDEY